MPVRYCIWAAMLLLSVPATAGQQPPASTSYGYTVFAGGNVVGREDVTVTVAADGITITGKGRLSGAQDIVVRRAEIRYRPDWTPDVFELEAAINGGDTVLHTTFSGGTVVTQGVDGLRQISQTDVVPGQVIVLPSIFFGSYEALTRRLASAEAGQEFPAFVGMGSHIALRLVSVGTERMQSGTSTFSVRRYALAIPSPFGATLMNLYADESGSLLRIHVPARSLDVMRDDLASSTARTVVYSNPADEAVNIPAAGFNLGATLTRPRNGAARLPAVILLAGANTDERDGIVAGVPILGQIAGALAEAGFLAVRYDKRGHGQSGGRAESATLGDHAEDAHAVVRWLANRRDVDRDRIAVLGHAEGAWTALLVAERERRIAAVITIAAPSIPGFELVLEQQRHMLEQMNAPPTERVAKIELQTRINAAVTTGRGWDDIPVDVRKQADTPWFQSFLTFDPATVIDDIRQPVLFVHGELDAEVPVSHVDRIADLARTESRSRSVAVVIVRGVNHLLIPAITGDVAEYATLKERSISADVKTAINEWLAKTFASIR